MYAARCFILAGAGDKLGFPWCLVEVGGCAYCVGWWKMWNRRLNRFKRKRRLRLRVLDVVVWDGESCES